MPFNLKTDLITLASMPFRRLERVGPVMEFLHKFLSREIQVKRASDLGLLARLRSWLLVVFSLWPADLVGIGTYACEQLEQGHELDEQMVDLIESVQNLPPAEAQKIIAAQERRVETGEHNFLKNTAKYDARDKALKTNQKFDKEWSNIKRLYPGVIEKLRDPKSGVYRRTMIMERNFRPQPEWNFKGDCQESRFRSRFNILCSKFHLYGVQWDTPLLMKPTITVTALTYEISLPRYAGYDRRRDFNWELYDQLQAIEDTIREGEKWNESREVRDAKALRTLEAHNRGVAAGKKGKDLHAYIIEEAELEPTTQPRDVLRLRHRAEDILLERETEEGGEAKS